MRHGGLPMGDYAYIGSSSEGGPVETVRSVLYAVLAVLIPLGAVVFANRSQGRSVPPRPPWIADLTGDGPPYPAPAGERAPGGRRSVDLGGEQRRRADRLH